LAGFKVSEELIEMIVRKTDQWTAAEVQEFINSLNLYFINQGEDEAEPVITEKIVESVFDTVRMYCVSRKGGNKIGFGA
jgi:uncharacterized protein (DUF2164 family)